MFTNDMSSIDISRINMSSVYIAGDGLQWVRMEETEGQGWMRACKKSIFP